jgi:hypothetical protein
MQGEATARTPSGSSRWAVAAGAAIAVALACAATVMLNGSDRDQPSYDAGYASGTQQAQVYQALSGELVTPEVISLRCETAAKGAATSGADDGTAVKAGQDNIQDFRDGCVAGYTEALHAK